jgi:hypothetical protein
VEPIASTLEAVIARNLKRAKSADGPLLAWPLACGSAVAARTRAIDFRSGVLWVEVPDKGWRIELVHLASRYLAAINKYAAAPVNRIEFVLPKQNSEARAQK